MVLVDKNGQFTKQVRPALPHPPLQGVKPGGSSRSSDGGLALRPAEVSTSGILVPLSKTIMWFVCCSFCLEHTSPKSSSGPWLQHQPLVT